MQDCYIHTININKNVLSPGITWLLLERTNRNIKTDNKKQKYQWLEIHLIDSLPQMIFKVRGIMATKYRNSSMRQDHGSEPLLPQQQQNVKNSWAVMAHTFIPTLGRQRQTDF